MRKIILALLFVSVTGLQADETGERCKALAQKLNIAIEQYHEVGHMDPCGYHDAVINVLKYSRTLKRHCMEVDVIQGNTIKRVRVIIGSNDHSYCFHLYHNKSKTKKDSCKDNNQSNIMNDPYSR